MNDIAGIPYVEAQFDKNGDLQNQVNLPAGVTDLFVMSHGWNNNADDARGALPQPFENFVAVAQPADLPGRSFAIVGVIWPSKAFDELVAASGAPGGAEGSASLSTAHDGVAASAGGKTRAHEGVLHRARRSRQTIDEAKALLPDLEDKASARNALRGEDPLAAGPGGGQQRGRVHSFLQG